jgi:hypothetical protein
VRRDKTIGTSMPAMSERKEEEKKERVRIAQVLTNISKYQKERYVSRSKVELGSSPLPPYTPYIAISTTYIHTHAHLDLIV